MNLSKETYKAMNKVAMQRLSGRCKKVSERTLNVLEAICICDEILDNEDKASYEDTIDEDGRITA